MLHCHKLLIIIVILLFIEYQPTANEMILRDYSNTYFCPEMYTPGDFVVIIMTTMSYVGNNDGYYFCSIAINTIYKQPSNYNEL